MHDCICCAISDLYLRESIFHPNSKIMNENESFHVSNTATTITLIFFLLNIVFDAILYKVKNRFYFKSRCSMYNEKKTTLNLLVLFYFTLHSIVVLLYLSIKLKRTKRIFYSLLFSTST